MTRLMIVLPPGELELINSSEVQIIQSPGVIGLVRVVESDGSQLQQSQAPFPPLNSESHPEVGQQFSLSPCPKPPK